MYYYPGPKLSCCDRFLGKESKASIRKWTSHCYLNQILNVKITALLCLEHMDLFSLKKLSNAAQICGQLTETRVHSSLCDQLPTWMVRENIICKGKQETELAHLTLFPWTSMWMDPYSNSSPTSSLPYCLRSIKHTNVKRALAPLWICKTAYVAILWASHSAPNSQMWKKYRSSENGESF